MSQSAVPVPGQLVGLASPCGCLHGNFLQPTFVPQLQHLAVGLWACLQLMPSGLCASFSAECVEGTTIRLGCQLWGVRCFWLAELLLVQCYFFRLGVQVA